jgi:uncharacterized protein YggU (UPF0235/DUF167 family)
MIHVVVSTNTNPTDTDQVRPLTLEDLEQVRVELQAEVRQEVANMQLHMEYLQQERSRDKQEISILQQERSRDKQEIIKLQDSLEMIHEEHTKQIKEVYYLNYYIYTQVVLIYFHKRIVHYKNTIVFSVFLYTA